MACRRQFRRYFDIAARRPGKTSDNMLRCWRCGSIMSSIADQDYAARQLVNHDFQVTAADRHRIGDFAG
jgi:hypothetical protein